MSQHTHSHKHTHARTRTRKHARIHATAGARTHRDDPAVLGARAGAVVGGVHAVTARTQQAPHTRTRTADSIASANAHERTPPDRAAARARATAGPKQNMCALPVGVHISGEGLLCEPQPQPFQCATDPRPGEPRRGASESAATHTNAMMNLTARIQGGRPSGHGRARTSNRTSSRTHRT